MKHGVKSSVLVLLCILLILAGGCKKQETVHMDSLYIFPTMEEFFAFTVKDERTETIRRDDGLLLLYLPASVPDGFTLSSIESTSYSGDYNFIYKNEKGERWFFSWAFGRDGEPYLQNSLQYGNYISVEDFYIQNVSTEYGEEVEVLFLESGQFFRVFMPQTLWDEIQQKPKVKTQLIS